MSDLHFEVRDGIAQIILNRPDAMNAFSEEMLDLWIDALQTVRDSNDIRVVIVKGNGKGFCAGGDMKEMSAGRGFYRSDEDRVTTGLARKILYGKRYNEFLYYWKRLIDLLLHKLMERHLGQVLIWH